MKIIRENKPYDHSTAYENVPIGKTFRKDRGEDQRSIWMVTSIMLEGANKAVNLETGMMESFGAYWNVIPMYCEVHVYQYPYGECL